MSNPVKFEDLFQLNPDDARNLQDFTAAVQALSRNYRNFSKNLEGDASRVKSAIDAISGQAGELRQRNTDLNLLNEKERDSIASLRTEAAKLVQERLRLEQVLAAQAKAQRLAKDATTEAVSALRAMQNELREAYKAQDTARIEKAALALRNARTETASLSAALRGANTEFTAAKGSYDALDAQNKRLIASLKALQGGLDGGGEEARKLEKQIEANTEALKAFDSRILVFNRNVGNYRDGFAGLVQELAKARAAQATLTQGTEDYNRQQIKVQGFQTAAQRSAAQMGLTYEQAEAKINGVVGALQPLATSLLRLEKEQREVAKTTGEESEQYRKLGFQIQATKKQLDDVAVATTQAEQKQSGLSQQLGFTKQGLEQYAAGLAVSAVGIGALVEGSKAFFNLNVEYSRELAEVRKTTGLTADEAERLAQALEALDTPTTLAGLLKIASVGGQLGVAKEDLLGFTKAIDTAVQALGNDFTGGAEEIATVLGKLGSVYRRELGPDQAQNILAIGSAINQIAADGAATAPFLTDVALRIGAIASSSKLGIDNALAYAAVLQEQGYAAEVSGTALNRLFSTLSTKTKQAYEIAKLANPALTLKEFTRLVNTDFNQAIQVFLKGLNEGGKSTTEQARLLATLKLQSGEAKSAIVTLAQNTSLFAERQKTANTQLREATSLAAEAAVNTDTLGSSVDKATNDVKNFFTSGAASSFLKWVVDVGRELVPASYRITAFFASFGATEALASIKRNAQELGLLGRPLDDYTKKLVESALASRKQAASQQELLKSYTELQGITGRTGAQEEELSKLRAKLGTDDVAIIQAGIDKRRESFAATKAALQNDLALFTKTVDDAQRQAATARDSFTATPKEADGRPNTQAGVNAAKSLAEAEAYLAEQQRIRQNIVAALAKLEDQKTKAVQDGVAPLDEAAEAEEQLDRAAQQRAKNRVGQLRDELADNQERLKQLRDYQAKQAKLLEDNQITPSIFADNVRGSEDLATQIQRDGAAIRIKIARAEAAERLKEADNDRIRQSEKKNISEAELTDIQQQYALRAVEIERQKNRDIAKAQGDLRKELAVEPLEISVGTKSLEILKNQLKPFVKTYESELADIGNAEKARESELLGQLSRREISQNQYERRSSKNQLDAANKALALDKKYHKATLDSQKEANEKLLADQRLTTQQRIELIQEVSNFTQQAAGSLFAIRSNAIDAQIQQEQEAYDAEITAAGNNAALKKQIEEKHQKELKRLQYEKAKADRQAALFTIAINTATAVSLALAQYPLPLALIPIAAALVIGGLQAAVVLSKPLPAYFKGRENGPAEFAQLGEQGPELVGKPGSLRLVTKPTVGYLAAGDRVYTAPKTQEILAQNELVEGRLVQRRYERDLDTQTSRLRALPLEREQANQRAMQQSNEQVLAKLEQVRRAIQEQEYNRLNEQDDLVRRQHRENGWRDTVNRLYRRNSRPQ